MITRSLVISLIISALCLLVIGGPLSNALFESPANASATTAMVPPDTDLLQAPSLVPWMSWGLLSAMTISGAVLTLSLRSLQSLRAHSD